MAIPILRGERSSAGRMFFHKDLLKAYQLADRYSGRNGKVATIPDIIEAKIAVDESDSLWKKSLNTTSGEFYGLSKGGTPIVIVAHGIDHILQDSSTMGRPKEYHPWDGHQIQLTQGEFQRLEEGVDCPVKVIPHSTVANMKKSPGLMLSYEEASEDPLLLARLGPKALEFLARCKEITAKVSDEDLIIVNHHRYLDGPRENFGGVIVMSQLYDVIGSSDLSYGRGICTVIRLSSLSHAARFVAMKK